MNLNLEAIIFDITRQADWRDSIATKFPDDPRNARAARMLRKLAESDTSKLDDSLIKRLEAASLNPKFRQTFSEANKAVGFRYYPTDLMTFLAALLDQLN